MRVRYEFEFYLNNRKMNFCSIYSDVTKQSLGMFLLEYYRISRMRNETLNERAWHKFMTKFVNIVHKMDENFSFFLMTSSMRFNTK